MLASNNLSESEIPMASICFCPGTKAKLNSTRTATTLAIGVSRIIFSTPGLKFTSGAFCIFLLFLPK